MEKEKKKSLCREKVLGVGKTRVGQVEIEKNKKVPKTMLNSLYK